MSESEPTQSRASDGRPLTVVFSFLSRADATPLSDRRRGSGHVVDALGQPLADPAAEGHRNAFESDSNINFEKWGEYWRKVHGVRFTHADGVDDEPLSKLLRYDQVHRHPAGPSNFSAPPYTPPLDEDGKLFPTIVGHIPQYRRPRWDGAAYLNFSDLDDVGAVLTTDRVKTKIIPEDLAMFRDIAPVLAKQFIIRASSTARDAITLVKTYRRKPSSDRAAFHTRWLEHADLFLNACESDGLVTRYVQLHNIGGERVGEPFYHPETSAFDGVSLFSFPNMNDVEAFLTSAAWSTLASDEREFAVAEESEFWTAVNFTVINRIQRETATARR